MKEVKIKGLMTVRELMDYLDISEGLAYKFIKEIGAERKVGRKTFVVKEIVDNYFATGEKNDDREESKRVLGNDGGCTQ